MSASYEIRPKPEKIEIVAKLREIVDASTTMILADQTGLSVKQISELRKRLEAADAKFSVVKNTLLRLATAGTSKEPLGDGLEGPTAMAYSSGDPVAVAKTLSQYIKETKVGSIKRGFVEGSLLSEKEIIDLATLPSRDVLVAQVVGGLASPMSSMLGTIQMVLANFAFTLQSIAEKREASA